MNANGSKQKKEVLYADEKSNVPSPERALCGNRFANDLDGKFLKLADLLPETVFFTDAQGTLRHVNRACLKTFGYVSDMKPSLPMLFVSHDQSRLAKHLEQCLQGVRGEAREYTALTRGGGTFPALVDMHPLLENCRCAGVIGFVFDVSPSKSATEKALTDEQKINTIIEKSNDTAPEGWVLCDFQGNILDACVTSFVEFNMSQEDLIGLNIFNFLDESMRESSLQFLQKVRQEGKASGVEHIRQVNGEERSFEYKDVVVYEGDQPVAVKIFVWDITHRIRDKQALEISEARYRGVFENTGLPIAILEENLIISMVNVRFEKLTGYAKNEIEEKISLAQFVDDDAKDGILKLFHDTSGDFPSEYECRLTNRSGEAFDMMLRFNNISGTGQLIATFVDITSRKMTEAELLVSRDHLRKEVSFLRSSLKECFRFGDIIGKSKAMQDVYETIVMAAEAKANIIIYGESGTGKELVARAIHQMSNREKDAFVTVNCGAIPENIIESEFFGYKKGAFTGAYSDRQGYLDFADGGTLFLDEVGELNLNMQVKLLRVIDGGGFIPLGANKIRKTDVRIIAATNRNLRDSMMDKSFREDFFYRLHIITIYLPPLRERKEDIPLLIDHFLKVHNASASRITGKIMDQFLDYDWPGNVRELQNVVQRYISMKKIDFAGSPKTKSGGRQTKRKIGVISNIQEMMDAYEKEIIEDALNRFHWHRAQVASALGINRKTLFVKMTKFGLHQTQNGVN